MFKVGWKLKFLEGYIIVVSLKFVLVNICVLLNCFSVFRYFFCLFIKYMCLGVFAVMSILFVNINVFYVYIIVSIVVLVSDRFVVFNFGVSEFFEYFLF